MEGSCGCVHLPHSAKARTGRAIRPHTPYNHQHKQRTHARMYVWTPSTPHVPLGCHISVRKVMVGGMLGKSAGNFSRALKNPPYYHVASAWEGGEVGRVKHVSRALWRGGQPERPSIHLKQAYTHLYITHKKTHPSIPRRACPRARRGGAPTRRGCRPPAPPTRPPADSCSALCVPWCVGKGRSVSEWGGASKGRLTGGETAGGAHAHSTRTRTNNIRDAPCSCRLRSSVA